MSWLWFDLCPDPAAGAVASAGVSDVDGAPQGVLCAWANDQDRPTPTAAKIDSRAIDQATIERVAVNLSAPCGLLYRYADEAGLAEDEGVFIVCSFWLVQCLAASGDSARAAELFERATAYTSDLGLLSEEADPATGELMGNFPHGPTHVGLINAAWSLSAMAEVVDTP